jgi:hypothetical protein
MGNQLSNNYTAIPTSETTTNDRLNPGNSNEEKIKDASNIKQLYFSNLYQSGEILEKQPDGSLTSTFKDQIEIYTPNDTLIQLLTTIYNDIVDHIENQIKDNIVIYINDYRGIYANSFLFKKNKPYRNYGEVEQFQTNCDSIKQYVNQMFARISDVHMYPLGSLKLYEKIFLWRILDNNLNFHFRNIYEIKILNGGVRDLIILFNPIHKKENENCGVSGQLNTINKSQ